MSSFSPLSVQTVLTLMLVCGTIFGQSSRNAEDDKSVGYWNWSTKTLGGRQFWTDVSHLDRWRIQYNHVTGHCRLLDPSNVRHAWGNFRHCQEKLSEISEARRLKPYSGKVVVLLHGLVRSHASMIPMAEHLRERGFQTLNFQYASSRATIGDHATALARIIEQLGPEVTEINFVGHSMGNLVVRHYLFNTRDASTGQEGDPRIKRMVMIGPPNQGSRMARLMNFNLIFNVTTGASGMQLSSTWDELESRLARPKFEFGIIAGGQADDAKLSNPLLGGKDDFTVSVEETKLGGASDFIVRPLLHSGMMKHPDSLQLTTQFLENGYFVSADKMQPIPSKAGTRE